MNTFFLVLAIGLLIGGVVWLFYLALEPLVRKWQPRALVGWTRLLSGTVRDPQVGRDVLAGTVAGTLYALVLAPLTLLPSFVNAAATAPLETSFAPLLGIRETLMTLTAIVPNAVTNGMLVIFVFAVLRALLRRTWLVVAVLTAAMLALTSLQFMSAPGGWTQLLPVMLAVVLVFIVVVRFGLLATIVLFAVGTMLLVMPLTADPSMRYFTASMWILIGVLALAIFAAHAARAGQPLFAITDD